MKETWYRRLAARSPCRVLHARERRSDEPYLSRYTVFKTRLLSVYLHQIHRSDSTDDYHDHPWLFFHVILEGGYWEERPDRPDRLTSPGSWAFRKPRYAHRLQLLTRGGSEVETWSLVVIGPRVRVWGFLGRLTGCWVPWNKYVFDGERCE